MGVLHTMPRVVACCITSSILGLGACGGVTRHPATQSIDTVDFACRLAVGSVPAGFGGFLSFPGGQFTSDPRSSRLYFSGPDTWVADSGVVSPDRLAYVRDDQIKVPQSTKIHVVDVVTGRDRAVWTEDAGGGSLSWQADGIYFLSVGGADGPGPNIWVIDPATGTQRLAVRQPAFGSGPELFKAGAAVGGGAVWSTAGPLIRVNPVSGKSDTWADYQHGAFDVIGWDTSGQTLVALSGGSLVRLVGPNRSEAIQADGFRPPLGIPTGAISDKHGTWAVAADGSIWLLNTPTRMKRVAQVPLPTPPAPSPMPSGLLDDMGGSQVPRLLVAGPCV